VNRKAERLTAPAAQNVYRPLRFDNVRFPILNLSRASHGGPSTAWLTSLNASLMDISEYSNGESRHFTHTVGIAKSFISRVLVIAYRQV
jgi:hypothetical protein